MPINPLPLRHWFRTSNAAKTPARNSPPVLNGRMRHVEVPVTIEQYGQLAGQQTTLTELLARPTGTILSIIPPSA